jgi:hypothetical protein
MCWLPKEASQHVKAVFDGPAGTGGQGGNRRWHVVSRGRFTLRSGAGFGDQMVRRFCDTGSAAPSRMGGRRSNILSGATRDWLVERMTRDFTLRGLVAELAGRGVKVDYVQVWVQVGRFAHIEG